MRKIEFRTTPWFAPSALAAALVMISACASASSARPEAANAPPTAQDAPVAAPAPDSLTGWIVFAGEFQIYPKKEDVGKNFDRSCTSGYFQTTKDQRAAARKFNGKRVKIEGVLIPVNEYWGDRDIVASPVENYCAGDMVFIARSIVAAPQ